MKNKKIVGVSCWVKDPDVELIKQAGIEYVRSGIGFPFADEKMTLLTEDYVKSKERIRTWLDSGLSVVGITPLYGHMQPDPTNRNDYSFHKRLPDWVGTHEDDKFYRYMTEAMTFVGEDLKGLVSLYQISNEMDMTRFRGPMTVDDAIRYMNASAKGIKLGNPGAKAGINPALLEEAGRRMLEVTSSPNNEVKYDYTGIDGYFASYHPGEPGDWKKLIDMLVDITKTPVLIYEWGYSSIGGYIPEGWPMEKHPKGESWICALQAWPHAWKGAHNEQVQADYIYYVMQLFAENPNVAGNLLYDWQDYPQCFCGRERCPHECGFGLVNREGGIKESYHAFQKAVNDFYR